MSIVGSKLPIVARCLACFILVLASSEGVAGQDTVMFLDDRPLVLDQAKAGEGVEVPVANVGSVSLQLKTDLLGFNFMENETALENPLAFVQSSTVFALDPGLNASVLIRLSPDRALDPGDYQGTLVVYGAKAGLIRKNVTIKIEAPEKASKASEYRSLVDKVVLSALRHRPPWSDNALSTPYLLLKVDEGGDVGINWTADLPAEETKLGILYNENRIGSLLVDGSVVGSDERYDLKDNVALLPIKVEGLDAVGVYSGTINVPSASGEATTAVEINVKDHWIFPVLAILLGLWLSFAAQWLWYNWRLKRRLKNRCNEWSSKYPKGENNTGIGDYGISNSYEVPNETAVEKYGKDFIDQLETYSSENLHFDVLSDGFKGLVKALELGERDVEVLGLSDAGQDKQTLCKSLKTLNDTLKDFINFVDDEFPDHYKGLVNDLQNKGRTLRDGDIKETAAHLFNRKPALVKKAAKLLQGGTLNVGDAEKLKARAEETTEFMKEWTKLAKRLKGLDLWGKSLQKVPEMSPSEKRSLQQAMSKIFEAREELWESEGKEALDEKGVADDLKLAYGRLAYLGGRYEIWDPPDRHDDPDNVDKLYLTMLSKDLREFNRPLIESQMMTLVAPTTLGEPDLPLNRDGYNALQSSWSSEAFPGLANQNLLGSIAGYDIDDLIDLTTFESLPPERILAIERGMTTLSEYAVLGFALVVAVIAAMSTLYFGENFGTAGDYVKAFLLGSGTEITIQSLNGKIKEMKTPLRS